MRSLLTNLRLEARLAVPIAEFVAAGQQLAAVPEGTDPTTVVRPRRTGAPMRLERVDDLLMVPGVKPEAVERLRPFVIVLPSSENFTGRAVSRQMIGVLMSSSFCTWRATLMPSAVCGSTR